MVLREKNSLIQDASKNVFILRLNLMILGQKEYSDLLLKSISIKKIELSKKSLILHKKFVGISLTPYDY